jgi:hypothetical protein
MKLESYEPAEDKKRWKIVRTDNYKEVPGEVFAADENTGECDVQRVIDGEEKMEHLNFGAGGIKLVRRSRR